ncbi:Nucleotide-binding universal stress protein, UspA family [Halopelagius inordinatus]|uniref:Nucleotide-binding universal stress protein, UspA family n=1 Tax=Halopelagius inordinatus TaxID=553467 RepID=A0A1I2RW83_9EURY|nr:universal stress protein [Halopelagius inordinatus]SFG42006.1 Nucleotide-binding universal stress protein, UspA family [Halopelagius inordinatus]
MVMYDRILVPTDGSEGSERVVEHAVRLADVHGATVHALYVVNSGSFAGLPMESSWEGLDEMLRADAEEAVAEVRRIATDADIPAETKIIDGSPSREIVEYAEREGCDLVVMGTHGRGGLDRLLLGSVAEKVIRASNVPVLTVRVGADVGDGEETGRAASRAEEEGVEGERESGSGVEAD